MVNNDIPSFIRRGDLSRDRSEQRPDRFAAGEVVDALVTTVDKTSRKVNLSIKAREVHEEKIAMAEFGSSDSGASLGDILGAAFKEHNDTSKENVDTKSAIDKTKPIAKKKADLKKKVEASTTNKKKTTTKKKTATAKKKAAPEKKVETEKVSDEKTTTRGGETAVKK
jgi:small subunit ribosomal protein S1